MKNLKQPQRGCAPKPRVGAYARQPWALGRNLVGVETARAISILCAIVFLFAPLVIHAADAGAPPLFTILYTAEAHAALLPCDCPLQPLGGVARRATLIARY